MEIKNLSTSFHVRFLTPDDVNLIYELSRKNELFYQHHPPFVTKESILEDIDALPPGKSYDDKYYIGYFDSQTLVAVMDLILDYPEKHTAHIGLFMINVQYQNKGIGSKIVTQCISHLKSLGFHKIRLGVDKGNPQSITFWTKNGFITVEKNEYIRMELIL